MTCQLRFCACLVLCSFLLASCGGGGGTSTATVNPQPNTGDNGNNGNNGDNGNDGNGGDNGNGGDETPSTGNILSATHGVRNLAKLNEIASGRGIAVFRVYDNATETDQNSILFLSDNIQGFTGGPVDESRVNYDEDEGMVYVGDTSYNLLYGYEDEDENAFGLLLSDANNELVVVVGSSPYTSLPTGSYRYQGVNVTSHKVESQGMTMHETYTGTFTLQVDFAAQIGTINVTSTNSEGQTMEVRSFSGTIDVNATDGRFSGNNLSYEMTSTRGGGSTTNSLDPVTISGIFNDGQATGVSGVYYTLNGSTGVSEYSGYILSEQAITLPNFPIMHNLTRRGNENNIALFTATVNNSSQNFFVALDGEQLSTATLDLTKADTPGFIEIGKFSVGGQEYDISSKIEVEDLEIFGYVFSDNLLSTNGKASSLAGGPPLTSFPFGSTSYRGTTFVINNIDGFSARNSGGTFTLNFNFDTGAGNIDIEHRSYSLVSNNLTLNFADGTFTGVANGEAGIAGNESVDPASIHGQFHDSEAAGVSGVFYDNTDPQEYAGAFVGTKQ